MRASISKVAIALMLAVQLTPAAAASLKFGGTGSATEMLRQVGAQFTAGSEVKVDVVPSLGSTGAISALADGNLDIAVSARPLKPGESARGLNQVAVLRTAFVFATSNRNSDGLRTVDLPKIFSATKPVWADGMPLRIILRPRSEADSTLLGTVTPGMDAAIERARQRMDMAIAATDQDNADIAERTPGSLIGTTLTQLKAENRDLRVVALDGVEPTLANFERGAYPLTKEFYFIVRGKSVLESQKFFDFMRSTQGIKALRAMNTLPGAE